MNVYVPAEYNVSVKEVTQFLEEATLMSHFHHDHVLGLTAVTIRDNHPFVILPYMENGDLKSFISNDENVSKKPQNIYIFLIEMHNSVLSYGSSVFNIIAYFHT